MFFTEQAADAIGALRVSPIRRQDARRARTSRASACSRSASRSTPTATSGSREGTSNRLGRMTLDQTTPFGVIPSRSLQHPEPGPRADARRAAAGTGGPSRRPAAAAPLPARSRRRRCRTASRIDRKGRVWYTGEASETVGYLDPPRRSRTRRGLHDTPGPVNEFGRALAPADIAIDAGRHRLHRRRVRRPDRDGDGRGDGSIDAKFALPPDRAQQPHRLAAHRPGGQPLVRRGRREPHHAHQRRRLCRGLRRRHAAAGRPGARPRRCARRSGRPGERAAPAATSAARGSRP